MTMTSKSVIWQAIDMIERQDLGHWSDAHDRVTLAALREFQMNWHDASPGQQWKCGDEFLPFHPQASQVPADYRDGWNRCYWMAFATGQKPG
jgi:hypothetical protein